MSAAVNGSASGPSGCAVGEVRIAEIQEEMAAILDQFSEVAVGLYVKPRDAADGAELRRTPQRRLRDRRAGR